MLNDPKLSYQQLDAIERRLSAMPSALPSNSIRLADTSEFGDRKLA
jgi:hypothetical protein